MVCEEQRDYMYRVYARDPEMRINIGIRRRLAPLLENDRRRIELMNALLLSLPGTPVFYYGDEIGMGDNVRLGDRNGVRTPMQWSAERNAGFSDADPEQLYLPAVSGCEYDCAFVNVEAQQHKQHSLLWWMRRALTARRESHAMATGAIRFLYPANRHVLAFVRKSESEDVLVVANLSRSAQSVRLDLSEYAGRTPVEIFARVEFPRVEKGEYMLSLTPYGYYWLAFRPEPRKRAAMLLVPETLAVPAPASVLDPINRAMLGRILLPYLQTANRFEPRNVTRTEIVDMIRLGPYSAAAIVEASFGGGDPELQLVPLVFAYPNSSAPRGGDADSPELARLQTGDGLTAALVSRSDDGALSGALMEIIAGQQRLRTECGSIAGFQVGPFALGILSDDLCLIPQAQTEAQRNASVLLGNVYVLKLIRRVEPGPNPDVEIVRFLFERAGFTYLAPAVGYLEYIGRDGDPVVLAVLHAFVNSPHDLWQYTLHQLGLFLDRAAATRTPPPPPLSSHPLDVQPEHVGAATDLVQTYLEDVRLLGQRLAEMHLAGE
jgi:maltose alpha-D-glucosyltransferase / alpha-amylase